MTQIWVKRNPTLTCGEFIQCGSSYGWLLGGQHGIVFRIIFRQIWVKETPSLTCGEFILYMEAAIPGYVLAFKAAINELHCEHCIHGLFTPNCSHVTCMAVATNSSPTLMHCNWSALDITYQNNRLFSTELNYQGYSFIFR